MEGTKRTTATTIGVVMAISVSLLALGPINFVPQAAQAQEQQQDISVKEPTRKLTVQWWQWVLSIPSEDNPLLDTTGEKCQAGDMGDIFFLVGTFGGSAERECTISEGQEIL